MKRTHLTSLILAAGLCLATSEAMAGGISQQILAINNSVALSATGTLMNYQEHINPGPSDTESGWLPGLNAQVRLTSDRLYFSGNYDYSRGDLNYRGFILSGMRGVSDGTLNTTDQATTMRVIGKAGYMIPLDCEYVVLTPYIAGGWQSWHRQLVGPAGYTERYSASLAGAGLKLQYAALPNLLFSGKVAAMAILNGGMTPSGQTLLDGTNAQFGVSGEEDISLGLDYKFASHFYLTSGLEFTHFTYTGGALQVSVPAYAIEPPSSTNLFSVRTGLRYSF